METLLCDVRFLSSLISQKSRVSVPNGSQRKSIFFSIVRSEVTFRNPLFLFAICSLLCFLSPFTQDTVCSSASHWTSCFAWFTAPTHYRLLLEVPLSLHLERIVATFKVTARKLGTKYRGFFSNDNEKQNR